MNAIAVITDTDSSLPAHVAQAHGIVQVPITIHFGEESFTCGLDIDDMQLFQKVDSLHRLPTTSAPPPAAFQSAFADAFARGADSIVCICVSSKVSATYAAAVAACEAFPARQISVIDSLNLSMGQGFLVLAAVEAVQAGADHAAVLAVIEDTRQRSSVFAVLATLKYLALSGRVGKLAAGMADTLNVKPLLSVRAGKLEMLEKVRTRHKAIDRMIELTGQQVRAHGIERLAVLHVNNLAGAQDLQALLRAHLACPEAVLLAEFTPGLSVHAGSGVVGLAVVAAKP